MASSTSFYKMKNAMWPRTRAKSVTRWMRWEVAKSSPKAGLGEAACSRAWASLDGRDGRAP